MPSTGLISKNGHWSNLAFGISDEDAMTLPVALHGNSNKMGAGVWVHVQSGLLPYMMSDVRHIHKSHI